MRLYEFESKVKPEVYIDMDGVLVDFFDAWAKLMGEKSFRNIKDIDKGLQAIRDEDDFWLKLKPTPNAGKLLALVRELKGSYTILSSPLADDPRSEPHKRMWVEKNLKQFPPKKVIITGNKAKYAQQSDGTPNILIDDFGQNIDKWNAAGGIGVKHKDHKFERTFKELMNHLKKDEKTTEAWSEKYKSSINCNNPKGFSQKAHCAGRKKKESLEEITRRNLLKGIGVAGAAAATGAKVDIAQAGEWDGKVDPKKVQGLYDLMLKHGYSAVTSAMQNKMSREEYSAYMIALKEKVAKK